MAVSIAKLKKQLMDRIDSTDLMQVEKVERYINLVKIFNELDKDIKEQGTMIVTENGAQKYTKPNPAIAEKVKINSQLLNTEKSFGFLPGKDDDDDDSGLL